MYIKGQNILHMIPRAYMKYILNVILTFVLEFGLKAD